MFKNAKVGDRVWDFVFDWGTVTRFFKNSNILVGFEVEFDRESIKQRYGLNGIVLYSFKNQTLFWNEIKFEIPEKPFDLEAELRKLEIKEFVNDEMNYYLYWSNPFEKIKIDYTMAVEIPLVKYFLEDETLIEFEKKLKNQKITKEQFFTAYRNVFGGRNAD